MKNVELPFVKQMFETIAPHYDFLNRLLSLRQDVSWRRRMVAAMKIPKGGRVLDVACGTGDVVLEMLRQKGGRHPIAGVDFSPGMLRLANAKIKAAAQSGRAALLAADAFDLPFAAGCFDAVTIAFGIRNIADKRTVLEVFRDQLKPGGMLLVLELSTPEKGLMRQLYLFYFRKILPLVGGFFSKNERAYEYLPASVLKFPQAADFAAMMRRAGFRGVRWQPLTLGIVTLYRGRKPLDRR